MSEIVERNIGQSRFFDQFLIMNVIVTLASGTAIAGTAYIA